jgi:endogenous inhibitor of DNA gyrase (YacG/DUF329 family)
VVHYARTHGMKKPPEVRCPTCKKKGAWFAGPYGPFCSRRCKLVDLGKWLNEEHAISEPLRPEHFTRFADLEPGEHLDQTDGDEKR